MDSSGGPMTDKQGIGIKEFELKLFMLWLCGSIRINYGNEKKIK
jgi:hypothetical protein